MYRFADVEAALMAMYGVGDDQRPAFRARIKYFQRIGIARSKPGKGQKLTYELEDFSLWALALEFSEFGVEPTRIAGVIKLIWSQVFPHLELANNESDVFLVSYPYIMTFETFEISSSEAMYMGLFAGDLETKWVFTKSELSEVIGARALIISLSRLRDRIKLALDL